MPFRARLSQLKWPSQWHRPRYLRAIPLPALQLIGLLVLVNGLVWVAAGILLHYNPKLISPAVLSYTLGLRHALDADHISAIDLLTRRLIASGQRPVAVGTFFSLGHSTVVIVTCVVVAATAGALRERFDDFQRVGGIVGTSVSAAFLLLLCAGNGWVLWRLVKRLRSVLEQQRAASAAGAVGDGESEVGEGEVPDVDAATEQQQHQQPLQLEGPGFLGHVFRRVFKMVDRPWKMLPLGILFGLGFDTSSEIAILGIASIQAAQGTSMWVILIFPALFTAGMCLLDTTDGALMMALYTSKVFSRDVVAILYYSIVLTGITVFVAAFIGIIQVLSLVEHVAEPEGSFWEGVGAIGDHYDIIGGCICGLFVLVGLGSVLVYRPWRRRMARRANRRSVTSDSEGRDAESLSSEPRSPDLLLPQGESSSRAPGYGATGDGPHNSTTKVVAVDTVPV
ncbi:high-affinity nickel-transport protein-domain-containing protein [Corynascus similis CBS 632.67]